MPWSPEIVSRFIRTAVLCLPGLPFSIDGLFYLWRAAKVLTRLFYGFVLAGMALIILAAGVFPLPENQRYRSSIAVIPDGGREETFTIQWPRDRLQPLRSPRSGALLVAGSAVVLPAEGAAGASAEIFRLRDVAGNVIGLASRSTSMRRSPDGGVSQGSDWTLLIPSRGSLFLTQANSRDVMPRPVTAGGNLAPAQDAPAFWAEEIRLRITAGPAPGSAGQVVGGTEEFVALRGAYEESWDLEEVAADGSTRGRITLTTRVQKAE
jgi:hypothetical protein